VICGCRARPVARLSRRSVRDRPLTKTRALSLSSGRSCAGPRCRLDHRRSSPVLANANAYGNNDLGAGLYEKPSHLPPKIRIQAPIVDTKTATYPVCRIIMI
jgi:hypothetical protein